MGGSIKTIIKMADGERTFIAIKPDGVQRGLVGKIIARFEEKGFKMQAMKMVTATEEHLRTTTLTLLARSSSQVLSSTWPLDQLSPWCGKDKAPSRPAGSCWEPPTQPIPHQAPSVVTTASRSDVTSATDQTLLRPPRRKSTFGATKTRSATTPAAAVDGSTNKLLVNIS